MAGKAEQLAKRSRERRPGVGAIPAAAIAVLLLALLAPASASAFRELVVDRTDDRNTLDGSSQCFPAIPNDCTLRGALERNDRTVEADLVTIPAGIYRRDPTLPRVEVLQSVTIAGADARSTIIEGAGPTGPGPALAFAIQAGQATPNTSAIRDVTITKGTNVIGGGAASSGGGIESSGTNLFLDRVSVTGNLARGAMPPGSGAGIGFGTAGRTLTIDASAITGNRAEGGGTGARGAGIEVAGGSATIRSSTIAGNVADGNGTAAQGGGLAAVSGASVSLDRVTVAGNAAEDVGAGQAVANLWRDGGTATITATRSIVADGIAPAGSNAENCATPITTLGSNVEDRNQCGFGAADRRGSPVGLGALANYGGPTDTRSITQASPAFDFAGDCAMADQRGFAAAFGGCDSGAFELQPIDAPDGSPPPGGAPGGGGTAADVVPADLNGYGLSRKRFAAADKGATGATAGRKRAKVGTKVSYELSEAATVTFTVERVKGGRRVGGRCVKATRRNRSKPRCDLPLKGSFADDGAAGVNSLRFSGRLGRKALRPGSYRLVATALDATGNATVPQRTVFRIVARR